MYINDNRQNNILIKKTLYKIIYINKIHIKKYKLYFKNLIKLTKWKIIEDDINSKLTLNFILIYSLKIPVFKDN